jgi:predicted transcriptional regulator of viral defense system
MEYIELKKAIQTNLFTLADVKKHFPHEKDQDINVQLSRFKKRGLIHSFKRGIYCFSLSEVNDFELANKLYQPSYISLETALHYYGIIPDIPQKTVSVNPIKPKEFKTDYGTYIYHKIKQELFWGYKKNKHSGNKGFFLIAEKEKALLDYFYLRKIKETTELRLDLKDFDVEKYQKYVKHFPEWINKIKLKDE